MATTGPEPPASTRTVDLRPRLVAIAAFLVAVALFFGLGGYDRLRDAESVVALLTAAGVVGPALFVLTMWLVQPLGVPGVVWMIPAGVIWPWPLAIAVCWVGNLGASSIGFAFSRWAGRDWVEPRLPPRVRRFDERLERGGVIPVIVLRLVTGQLAPADWVLGVSRVRWPAFLVGTAIGIVPQLVFFVVVGSSAFVWLADRAGLAWIVVVVVTLALLVAAGVRRRRPTPTA